MRCVAGGAARHRNAVRRNRCERSLTLSCTLLFLKKIKRTDGVVLRQHRFTEEVIKFYTNEIEYNFVALN